MKIFLKKNDNTKHHCSIVETKYVTFFHFLNRRLRGQGSIPVGCEQTAWQLYELHNKQVWTCFFRAGSIYSQDGGKTRDSDWLTNFFKMVVYEKKNFVMP